MTDDLVTNEATPKLYEQKRGTAANSRMERVVTSGQKESISGSS